jgi:hypothetical protein
MRFLVLLFFILVASYVEAKEYDLPDGLLSDKLALQNLRLPLERKISQMQQNFSIFKFENGFTFLSSKDEFCPMGDMVKKGMPVSKIVVTGNDLREQKLTFLQQQIIYYGCDGRPAFRENIITKGDGIVAITPQDVLNGNIADKLLMQPLDTEKSYELLDHEGKQVFRVNSVIEDDIKVTWFYVENVMVRKLSVTNANDAKIVNYFLNDFKIKINRNGYNFNSTTRISGPRTFIGYFFKDDRVDYRSVNGDRLSLVNMVNKTKLNGENFLMEMVLMKLPRTQFVSLSNRNRKFIQELRDIQGWLISNINITTIQAKIEEYIKAAQSGQIEDKRP